MGEIEERLGRHLYTHTHTDVHRHIIPTLPKRGNPIPWDANSHIESPHLCHEEISISLLHYKGKAVNLFGRLNELIFIKVLTID